MFYITLIVIEVIGVSGLLLLTPIFYVLNDSLGMDLRINNGVPEWSTRGADTWSPFKSINGLYYNQDKTTASTTTKSVEINTQDISNGRVIVFAAGSQYNVNTSISLSGDSLVNIDNVLINNEYSRFGNGVSLMVYVAECTLLKQKTLKATFTHTVSSPVNLWMFLC